MIDDQHRLHADVPEDVPPGRVRVIVLWSEEDRARSPAHNMTEEWTAEIKAVVKISAPWKTIGR